MGGTEDQVYFKLQSLVGICLHRMLPWRHLGASNANVQYLILWIPAVAAGGLFKQEYLNFDNRTWSSLSNSRLTAVLGDRELIQAELPPYEYPPPWIPIQQVHNISQSSL